MITIVDYGLGNIRAFLNVYQPAEHRRRRPRRRAEELRDAIEGHPARRRLVRSRDGAAGRSPACARRSTTWRCDQQVPVLGVCVGMQMLGAQQRRRAAAGPGLDRRPRQGASASLRRTTHCRCRTWAGTTCAPSRRSRLFDGLDDGRAVLFPAFVLLRLRSRPRTRSRSPSYGGDFACAVQRREHLRRAVPSREEPSLRGPAAEELRGALRCCGPRIIPCLLVRNGGLVKTVQFSDDEVRRRSDQRREDLQREGSRRADRRSTSTPRRTAPSRTSS